jgi:hypothetical protein
VLLRVAPTRREHEQEHHSGDFIGCAGYGRPWSAHEATREAQPA